LEFDVVEYESFSYESNEIESLDVRFCVEYESFCFDPIITYHLFEPSKSEVLESEIFVPIIVDSDQTLGHAKIKRLVDLGLTNMARYLVHNYHMYRLVTHLLANCEHISLFDVWPNNFLISCNKPLLVPHFCYVCTISFSNALIFTASTLLRVVLVCLISYYVC